MVLTLVILYTTKDENLLLVQLKIRILQAALDSGAVLLNTEFESRAHGSVRTL